MFQLRGESGSADFLARWGLKVGFGEMKAGYWELSWSWNTGVALTEFCHFFFSTGKPLVLYLYELLAHHPLFVIIWHSQQNCCPDAARNKLSPTPQEVSTQDVGNDLNNLLKKVDRHTFIHPFSGF